MKTLFVILFMSCPLLLLAQGTPPATSPYAFAPRIRTADLSLATNGDLSSVALTVNQLHGLGRSHRFRVGYGLRFTATTAGQLDYVTAPAKLTSGKQSLAALFSENINDNLDTLRLGKTQTNSLNLSIHLEYGLTRRLAVGFNIDAVGVTFGAEQSGTFIANGPTRSSLHNSVQTAKPTTLNALLISDSDIGSLNSEGYVRYRVSPKLSLRGGIGFQFTEYTTTRKLTLDNDRFRSKNAGVQLAVAYQF
ncbi:MAG: hypothetical protein EAZ91_19155 [Cytophagales bacterium]|nr:MAG: hypothetical protein EAZ91_19155 [Cytophagales bacterium]